MKTILTALIFFLAMLQNAAAQCDPAFTVNYSINDYKISCIANSTDTSTVHTWFFGDGQEQTGKQASHSYDFPGTYTIKHVVFDPVTYCTNSSSQTIILDFTINCNADFNVLNLADTFFNPYSVYLTSSSSYSGSGIKNSAWTLNGQNIDSGDGVINQVSTDLQQGTNNICLHFTTNSGCSASICKTIVKPVSCGDSLSFTITRAVDNPNKLTFTPKTDLPGFAYFWSFGDYAISTERAPTHTYKNSWTFPVRLAIRNSTTNCLDTALQYISIDPSALDSCTASFSYSLNSEGKIFLTGQSNQSVISQSWHIYKPGKLDTNLIAFNPTYQLIDTGFYSICLTLQTNTGCIRSSCNTIIVDSILITGGKSTVNSYPNPVNGSFVKMDIVSEDNSIVYYNVYSVMGKNVFQSQMKGHVGINTINIPVQSLNKGQYFVEIVIGNKKKRSVFQKL